VLTFIKKGLQVAGITSSDVGGITSSDVGGITGYCSIM